MLSVRKHLVVCQEIGTGEVNEHFAMVNIPKIVSVYDQEIPQSQTADNPVAPRGRGAQPPRDTRKTN